MVFRCFFKIKFKNIDYCLDRLFETQRTMHLTSAAPLMRSVFAHSSSVAPVVLISSHKRIRLSVMSTVQSSLNDIAPKRFPLRATSSRVCCGCVAKGFSRSCSQGVSIFSESAVARSCD